LASQSRVPDASVYRLSLYHCYLGELHRTEGPQRITSGRLAQELNIKEETVRRDLSFIGGVGRPGAGYESDSLFRVLQDFLGLSDEYPIIEVGSAQMVEALSVVFPAESYGVRQVGYFSENAEDVGKVVQDIEVRNIEEIPMLVPAMGVSVALVACSPRVVQRVIDLLHEAGITGVMLLTPSIKIKRPDGMTITHVRMPCDLKSIACRCRTHDAGPLPTG
jgi:redox-sensing transcriptional repressor